VNLEAWATRRRERRMARQAPIGTQTMLRLICPYCHSSSLTLPFYGLVWRCVRCKKNFAATQAS
jgi:ribosomal protein L37AE/L43A